MAIANVLFVYIIFLTILIGIPVLIGVYVYRDAKRRNMNAPLWTLIAILAPSLIGFVIYLFVRGNYDDLQCGRCGTAITQQYIVCPSCGAKLKPVCMNCNEPVELGWKVCPKCAQPLENVQEDVVTPTRKKDKTLQRILLVVIIVPIAFILIMLVAFMSLRVSTSTGGLSTMEATVESYLTDMNEPRIEQWIEECKDETGIAHVLEYEEETEDEERVRYLIYIPNSRWTYSAPIDGIFGTTLKLKFESIDSEEENIVLATYTGDEKTKLKLYLNGEIIDMETLEINYSPALSSEQLENVDANYVYEIDENIELE